MRTLSATRCAALCEALRAIPVAVVSDVMAVAGLVDRVVSSSIAPLGRTARITGPALCFSGSSSAEPAPDPGLVYAADRRITSGDVVVLGTGGFRTGAVIGGNTLAGWRIRGCAGVVTDGFARDVDALALATFAAGVTPLNTAGRWVYRSLDAPVLLPGQSAATVEVRPGDIVHADRDGIVIVPRRHLASITADAVLAERVEQSMRSKIDAGQDRGQVYLSHDRFGHVRRLPRGK